MRFVTLLNSSAASNAEAKVIRPRSTLAIMSPPQGAIRELAVENVVSSAPPSPTFLASSQKLVDRSSGHPARTAPVLLKRGRCPD